MTDPNPKPLFCDPVGPWHDWFAWKPVRTYDNRFVWLRTIRRRCLQAHAWLSYGALEFSWQYAIAPKEQAHV